MRKKYKESFKAKYEVGLGFMSFFTKACCVALQDWPAVKPPLLDPPYCSIRQDDGMFPQLPKT